MPTFTFYVPPENQGQIVEVSYAMIAGELVMRKTYDRSDRTTRYAISNPLRNDEGDYWNGAPNNKRWRVITERAAHKLLGEE